MKVFKIDFDKGKVDILVDQHYIQGYKFYSFYDVCELVLASHLPDDEMLTNVVTKEKFIPILECYIEQMINIFLKPTSLNELSCLQLYGSLFSYSPICVVVEKIVKNNGLTCEFCNSKTDKTVCSKNKGKN